MIRFFHAYKTCFNPRSRLLLVGAHSGFERYLSLLHNFIAKIGAEDVHLVGHVSNEELVAYYELADVFVCASEHEGFCVPLVESFHMGVPVIAYAATAVPSTMDGGGRSVYEQGSAARRRPHQRRRRRRFARGSDRRGAGRRARAARGQGFRAARCCGHVDGVLASPRREHPPVAFDFWDQVEQAEEYDEIKRIGRRRSMLCRPSTAETGDREPGPDRNDRQPVGSGGA